MKKLLYVLSLISSLLIFNSCGSRRYGKRTIPKAQSEIQAVIEAQPQFSNLYISKASLRINIDGRKMSMTGRIQVLTDSIVVLTVQPFFGIEMFRLVCYPTKIEIINKLKRQYAVVDYDYIHKKTGIPADFAFFEALFSNRLFLTKGTKSVNLENSFSLENSGDSTTLLSNVLIHNYEHRFEIDANKRIVSTTIGEKSSPLFNIDFSDFKPYGSLFFPSIIHGKSKTDKKEIDIRIQIKDMHIDKTKGLNRINLKRYQLTTVENIGSIF